MYKKNVKLSEKYTIKITVKNCGSETWSHDDKIRLCIWQDDFDYGFRVDIPEDVEIATGEQWTFLCAKSLIRIFCKYLCIFRL